MFSLSALFDVFCSDGRFFGDDCAAGVDICLGLTVAPLLATGSVVSGTAGEENSASAAIASSSSSSSTSFLLTAGIVF